MRFKDKRKYTLSRVVGERAIIKQKEGEVDIYTDAKTYRINRALDNLSEEDYILTGSIKAGTSYILDVPYYKENISNKPWHERIKILNNEFNWNNSIKFEKPLVASDKHEFNELVKMYKMSPDTDKIKVKKYNGDYTEKDYTVEV